jgi:CMP-N,N'-diacetyllegionaminic acid synthase
VIAAIIPARGHSVAVPRKNLRLLDGKPLLSYAIESARAASVLDLLVVSTGDDEIAAYATARGVQILRHPMDLSTDTAPTFPVIQWDLRELRRRRIDPEICVVLRATSPLRTGQDIDAAVRLLTEAPFADSVVSVGPAIGIHPLRLKRILGDGRLQDAFTPEGAYPVRRQTLEQLYVRNGAIYAAKASVIDGGGLWGPHCLAYLMPEDRSININTELQFKVAELLIRQQRSNTQA